MFSSLNPQKGSPYLNKEGTLSILTCKNNYKWTANLNFTHKYIVFSNFQELNINYSLTEDSRYN